MRIRSVILAACLSVGACKGNIGPQPRLEGKAERERPPQAPKCEDPGIKPSDVPIRRITDRQYDNTIRTLFDSTVTPGTDFPATTDWAGYSTSPEANVVSLLGSEEIMSAAEEVAAQVVPILGRFLPCAATADETCARQFITDFGAKVFRRPVRADEETLLVGLFQEVQADTPFPESIGIVLTAMLQMPGFLYLVEEGRPQEIEPGIIPLTGYEIASRLSFAFLDRAPDSGLIAAAADGRLDTPEGIAAETRRLLGVAAAQDVLGRFHSEWLGHETFGADAKDTSVFPTYDPGLAESLNQEIGRFVAHVMTNMDGSLKTLLTTRESVVNQPLARLYGLDPSVSAGFDDWQVVTLDERRAGILSRAAVLATHAHPAATSPVFRGKMVRTRLLCQDLPAPPPAAQTSVPDFPPDATAREKTEILLAEKDCGGCHRLMNPIGLGFENFDGLGQFRNAYANGAPIDATGEVVGNNDITVFYGNADLVTALSTSRTVHDCMARQWFRSTYGRREKLADKCSIDGMREQLASSNLDIGSMLVAMTTSDAFRYRRTTAMQDLAPQQ